MSADIGPVSIEFAMKNLNFEQEFRRINDGIRGVTNNARMEADKTSAIYKQLAVGLGTYFTVDALKDFVTQVASVRGEFQQMEIAFRTMLGSKEKSDTLMREIVTLAATTPLTLQQVGGGVKQLLAYQVSANEVVGTLERLGNVAAGLGIPMDRIILAYGQVKAKGKIQGDDIRQFSEAGIPIIHELAKVMGKADSEVSKLTTSGKVGFKEVQQVFESLTAQGGMFYNMMAEQSKSIPGQTSMLKDAWSLMLNDIGKSNEGIITSSIQSTTYMIQHYQTVIDIVKVMVASYGAYKAAVIAMTVAEAVGTQIKLESALAGRALTIEEGLHAIALKIASAAQLSMNKAVLGNPYILAAVALAALVSGLYVFATHQTEANKVLERHGELKAKAKKDIDDEKAKTESLIATAKNEKLSLDDREKAIQKLHATGDPYLKQLSTQNILQGKGIELLKSYNVELERETYLMAYQDEKTELFKKKFAAQRKLKEAEAEDKKTNNNISTPSPFSDPSLGVRSAIETGKNVETIKTEIKAYDDGLKMISDEEAKYRSTKSTEDEKSKIRSISTIDDEIKALKDRQDAESTTHAQKVAFDKDIAKLEAEKLRITGPNKKAIADQNREELRSEKQDFEDLLKDKKDKYTIYQKWVEFVSKDAADKQFSGLIKEGTSFSDYIDKQIESLKGKKKLTPEEKSQLSILESKQQDEQKNDKEKKLNDFKKDIEEKVQGYKKLEDQVKFLSETLDSIKGDVSEDGIRNTPMVAEMLDKAKRDLKAENVNKTFDLSKQYMDYEQKKKEIIKTGSDEITMLLLGGHQQQAAERKKAMVKELQDLSTQNAEVTKQFDYLTVDISQASSEALKQMINLAKKSLDTINLTPEKKQEIIKFINDIQRQVSSTDVLDFGFIRKKREEIAVTKDPVVKAKLEGDLGSAVNDKLKQSIDLMGKLADGVRPFNSGLADSIGLITNIGSTLTVAFDKTKKMNPNDAYGSIISGATQLIGIVTSATAQRKKEMDDYYRSIIQQQSEYNFLLNEQVRLNADVHGSVFLKDYEGRLTSGAAALTSANKTVQDGLDKLTKDGRAVVDKKNVVNGNNVLGGAGAGAAMGASIGALAGGGVLSIPAAAAGAIIGFVVGGIVGLFGGKKKENVEIPILDKYKDLVTTLPDGTKKFNVELAKTLITSGAISDSTKDILQDVIKWQEAADKAKAQLVQVVSDLTASMGDDLRNGLVKAFTDGTDAAVAFGASVNKVLENIMSNMIFNKVFEGAFKKLQDDMTGSYSSGGDNSWLDDFQRFFAGSGDLIKQFNSEMQNAQDAAGGAGFDIFKPTTANTNSVSGAIKGVDQATANIVAGQLNAMRINQTMSLEAMNKSLTYLAKISSNTDYNFHLESIDKKLDLLKDLRVKGLGG